MYKILDPVLPVKLQQTDFGNKAYKLAKVLGVSNEDEMYSELISLWETPSHVVKNTTRIKNFLGRPNSWPDIKGFTQRMMFMDAMTYLPDDILVKVDRASMAVSLETRVPFLDNDLVDFAMKCPVGLKLNNLSEVVRINENDPGNKTGKYFRKTNDGKQVLRNAMKNYVPDSITNAAKQGFSSPDASWFKGESIDYVRNKLIEGTPRIYDLFDRTAVEGLVKQHLNGEQNRRLLIWSLLNVEAWLEQEQG